MTMTERRTDSSDSSDSIMELVSYDPKEKKHSPFKSVLKFVSVVLVCVGIMVAIRVQKGLMDNKDALANLKTNAATHMAMAEKSATTNKAKAAGFSVATASTESPTMISNPNLPFNTNKPVIVLTLPHNADLAISRFFRCAGVLPTEIGRLFSTKPDQVPLGTCMHANLLNNATMTKKCGKFAVFSELQAIEPPLTRGAAKHGPRCFDPVLFPGAIKELYKALPSAIVLTVQQDPLKWYSLLPRDIKSHWKKWCNPSHMNKFPTSTLSKTKYTQFYRAYQEAITSFIQQHPGWKHIHIDLESSVDETANMLESTLQIPPKCWRNAIADSTTTQVKPKRPNTIGYPILNVALPKSGASTTHNYFSCGLGPKATSFQWTTPSSSTVEEPGQDTPIGMCIEENIQNDSRDILKGCGYYRVWNDIGYVRDNIGKCYYPTMVEGVLEKFAAYYPTGTILQVLRQTQDWYHSAHTFNNLPTRWSNAKDCPGFPKAGSSPEEWYHFYEQHTQSIRDFAAKHANLTYIEIPLTNSGGATMQDIFQFPEHCWPDIKKED